MVKGSGSVGMWSTCKVVHHVHAVGALVHQAEQARSLNARLRGGRGGNWFSTGCQPVGRVGGQAQPCPPARLASWPGLSQYQQLARTFLFYKKQKNVVQFCKTELQI